MEEDQSPEQQPQRKSPRDELFYRMAAEGWANESGGYVDSPMGRYARIGIEGNEIAEIRDAFQQEAEYVPDAELAGHFILVEDGNGYAVYMYADEWSARRYYGVLQKAYSAWYRREGEL
jgi:hypothetical protein